MHTVNVEPSKQEIQDGLILSNKIIEIAFDRKLSIASMVIALEAAKERTLQMIADGLEKAECDCPQCKKQEMN